MDAKQFLADASQATAGRGIDTEPVCYMGAVKFVELMRSVGCPVGASASSRAFCGIEIFIIKDYPNHYHMTFRRKV